MTWTRLITLVWSFGVTTAVVGAPPTLTLQHLGVADLARFDGPVGLRIGIDPGDLPPDTYILQWRQITPDGDPLLIQRRIPLTGTPTSTWVYGSLPHQSASLGRVQLRSVDQQQAVAELNLDAITTMQISPPGTSLMLVVGSGPAGLDRYHDAMTDPIWGTVHTSVHATTSQTLPDRVEGLRAIDTIVWTGSTEALEGARLDAVESWLQSGGHLIVSLPGVGDPWQLQQEGGPLSEFMPASAPRITIDPQDVLDLLSPDHLITSNARVPLVRSITPSPADLWHSILELPDGRSVAMARGVGHGRLTVIGLDVASRTLDGIRGLDGASPGALPSAAVFWNPILARRTDSPTAAAAKDAASLSSVTPKNQLLLTDTPIGHTNARTTNAGGRLALVLLLLGIYWVVAIPGLWWVLGKIDRRDLAWPAFLITGGIAAGIVALVSVAQNIAPRSIHHVTVLDQVAGNPTQRVRSWLELEMPGSGLHVVDVESDQGQRPTIEHWVDKAQSRLGFSSVRTLETDLENPSRIPVQARDTTTGLRLDWTGIIDPLSWTGLLRIEQPIGTRRGADGATYLTGSIRSELPRPLTDVSIIWIEATRTPRQGSPHKWTDATHAGYMPVSGYWWKLSSDWAPDTLLELSTLGQEKERPDLVSQISNATQASATSIWSDQSATMVTGRRFHRLVELMGLASLLPPPPWVGDITDGQGAYTQVNRQFGAELDLGAHLAGPTLLITGVLQDSPLPVTLMVDGDPVTRSSGDVLLRWRVPLPDRPIKRASETNLCEGPVIRDPTWR